jgi:glycine/D-amino acid oxidase-like deaminating enzyme
VSTSTAIIIGGGVIGLSTAYHLAKRKCGKVVVLEKGLVGDGSSSRAAGIITGHLWSEPGVLARKKGLQLYRELSKELGDYGYRFQDVGCLNLFDPPSWPDREKLLPLYKRCGAPFEILSAAEMRKRWPAITPREDFIGLYDPLGGYSEPHEYIPAITKKLREMGVEILEHQAVREFITRNGRVAGVKTNTATFEGDAVICTVYSWTLPLIGRLGWRLPVKTFVHQRYVTRPLPAPVKIPAINANPFFGYIRPAHGNRLLLGIETAEREEYRVPSVDWHMSAVSAAPELKDTLVQNFSSFVPDLKKTTWETEKVGLLTFSMDGEPILGPVAKFPGLHVAMAFHSGGFAYNPVAGFLMAEYVIDGRTSIDVSAFSPNRFDPKAVDEHLATTVAQKDAVRRRH